LRSVARMRGLNGSMWMSSAGWRYSGCLSLFWSLRVREGREHVSSSCSHDDNGNEEGRQDAQVVTAEADRATEDEETVEGADLRARGRSVRDWISKTTTTTTAATAKESATHLGVLVGLLGREGARVLEQVDEADGDACGMKTRSALGPRELRKLEKELLTAVDVEDERVLLGASNVLNCKRRKVEDREEEGGGAGGGEVTRRSQRRLASLATGSLRSR